MKSKKSLECGSTNVEKGCLVALSFSLCGVYGSGMGSRRSGNERNFYVCISWWRDLV